ncbi:S-adenosylmethionine:tRNA ribosyltransferase-isomerase [Streptomyces sp. NPDC048577]|uniref:S-adenosylmethionine:tRNA ribosyltransferase-isomerase n=1 Tax=Streptomyces sp. NPDC048577 TaxID=3157209 RepID=UPI0034476DA4
MPSAGRPFTAGLVAEPERRGVRFARSRCTRGWRRRTHEPPYPERFAVPAATGAAGRGGADGRVMAVGTPVVRALESAVDASGAVGRRGGRIWW